MNGTTDKLELGAGDAFPKWFAFSAGLILDLIRLVKVLSASRDVKSLKVAHLILGICQESNALFRGRKCLQTVLCLYITSQTTAYAFDGFSARGVIESKFFKSNGALFANQSRYFEIEVAGRYWRLTNYESNSNRWILGSSGEGVYQIFIDNVDKTERPINVGYVEAGPMPSGGYPTALPWLAFASADYWDATDEFFAPWANPYWEPLVHAYELDVQRSQVTPYLPTEVEFRASSLRMSEYGRGRFFRRFGVNKSEQALALARVRSVADGFVGGRFRVTEQTNFNGMLLPLKFELVTFRETRVPGPRTNSPVAAVYHGTGTDYRTTSIEDPLPDVTDRPVQVNDRRFRSSERPVDRIQYHITNRWIVSTNNPYLLEVWRDTLAETPKTTTTEKRRSIIVGAMGILALAPALFWFYRVKHTRLKAHQ